MQKGDIAITLNALGTVTPLATVTVRPQVSGAILRINFTEGQMVKAGDILAQIDPRPYKAAYDQAVGQLERDKATLANAQVDLKRDQALLCRQGGLATGAGDAAGAGTFDGRDGKIGPGGSRIRGDQSRLHKDYITGGGPGGIAPGRYRKPRSGRPDDGCRRP